MKLENVRYVEGAHQTYPQWNEISAERTMKLQKFNQELLKQGYTTKAINIACKDNALYWIIVNDKGVCELELYGYLE